MNIFWRAGIISLCIVAVGLWLLFSQPSGLDDRRETDSRPDNAETESREFIERVSLTADAGQSEPSQTEINADDHDYALFRSDPVSTYEKYIDLANDGDADAQFLVANILGECHVGEVSSLEKIDDYEQRGIFSDEDGDYYRALLNSCSELYDLLGHTNLKETQSAWMETAASNDHPIAKLQSAFSYPVLPSQGDARSMLVSALSYDLNDPVNRETAVSLAVTYYARYVELGKEQRDVNPIERNAWDLLSCYSNNRCDFQEMDSALDQYFSPFEAEASKLRMEELNSAVATQDFSTLNLW